MKLGGWIFMILSWGIIISMAVFCFSRILKEAHGKRDSKNMLKRLKK